MTPAPASQRIPFRLAPKQNQTKHPKPGACCVNSEAQESIFQMCFVNPLFSSEMPDTKAADEVDFLSNTRESSVSEEVAGGDMATTPKMMRQGPKTEAVSGSRSVGAQPVTSVVRCV